MSDRAPSSELTPSAALDITREVCPMTYVRTKLRLEELAEGALLEIRLAGAEPLKNVPRSAREEGHEVVSLEEEGEGRGVFRLVLRKGAAAPRRKEHG